MWENPMKKQWQTKQRKQRTTCTQILTLANLKLVNLFGFLVIFWHHEDVLVWELVEMNPTDLPDLSKPKCFEIKPLGNQKLETKNKFPLPGSSPRRVGFLGFCIVSLLISPPEPSETDAGTFSEQFPCSFMWIRPRGAELWPTNLSVEF